MEKNVIQPETHPDVHNELIKSLLEDGVEFGAIQDGEARQDYLIRLAFAVCEGSPESWQTLSQEAQRWYNEAAQAIEEKKVLPEYILPEQMSILVVNPEGAVFDPPPVQEPEKNDEAPAPVAVVYKSTRRGRRKASEGPSASEFCYATLLANPDIDVAELQKCVEEAGFPPMSSSTLNGMRYTARLCLRLLKAQGALKESAG